MDELDLYIEKISRGEDTSIDDLNIQTDSSACCNNTNLKSHVVSFVFELIELIVGIVETLL